MDNKGYYESVFGDLGQLRGSNKDYDTLAEKLAASGEPKPSFYLACGTEDDLITPNRAFPGSFESPASTSPGKRVPAGTTDLLGHLYSACAGLAAPGQRRAGRQPGHVTD